MDIIILTGSEKRHDFFRKTLSNEKKIKVLASYCEGKEKSLENRTKDNPKSSLLELKHVKDRKNSENQFFDPLIAKIKDNSNPHFIRKGAINDQKIVNKIMQMKPKLLICYGSSLIKSKLLQNFKGYFLNVHLGLSPYYRGSGTNIWPLINNEPHMVGATFMHIDEGIDTGKVIHQIRADIFEGDSPHDIGNRLIIKMTKVYKELILKFDSLKIPKQISCDGKLYLRKHFDEKACEELYRNFSNNMIEKFLKSNKKMKPIVINSIFKP